MQIVISGTPGSGKSTVAKLIAERLKLKYYAVGELQRRYAKERKISIAEFMRTAENYPMLDREIDNMQEELGKQEDDFILDSRLGAFFLPNATLKIFLTAKPEIRAKRIWGDKRQEETAKTPTALLEKMDARDASDDMRFEKLYEVSYKDPKLYTVTIDTSALDPIQVVEKIITLIPKTKKKQR